MTGITILVIALVAASAVGLFVRSRSGTVRPIAATTDSPELTALLVAAGARGGSPTVLHFSADWCGPCAAVRRVVASVLADLDGPAELELDIDHHPVLAGRFGVLSLPTTFILDADPNQRARIAGVPTSAALRSALVDL